MRSRPGWPDPGRNQGGRAGKVRILVTRQKIKRGNKRKKTYTLDSVALLFGHGNSLGTGGQGRVVVVAIFAQQAQELVRVLRNKLGQLGVTSTELLQDRLEHLGLLLDNLAELLELGIVAEEVEVTKTLASARTTCCCRSGGGCCCTCASTTASATGTDSTTTSLLRGEVEQVDTVVVFVTLGNSSGNSGSCGFVGRGIASGGSSSGRCLCRLSRLGWLLLQVVGNTLDRLVHMLYSSNLISRAGEEHTVRRYSTARSGLLKAARIAALIWLRSKPMASMLATASWSAGPTENEFGSV